jgi:hypothetical protein
MRSLMTKTAMSLILGSAAMCCCQSWKPILPAGKGINWSVAGAGEIPARTSICTRLKPPASVEQINFALASCHDGETVLLMPGVYIIKGTIEIPSNVTLRGAGANQTILKAVGTSGGDVISMGLGSVGYEPYGILSEAAAGSTAVEVTSSLHIKPGMYLAIAEANDPKFVTVSGSGGNCNWCDGGWTDNGRIARGQIVAVTAVDGNKVSFTPALYSKYANSPGAIPFRMATEHAGVENLQIYAMNTGYASNIGMHMCAYCWVKGVASNYADGDHVEIYWGFHDEVRDSYFSNAYLHNAGARDSDIQIGHKTSASLIQNNIIERTHAAIMLEWGAAGNVIAYNFTTGEFDSGALNLDIGGIIYHGAHPQFNLLEGNVVTKIEEDPVWGSSSHTTAFRNWVMGTNRICAPAIGRSAVLCSGTNSHYGFQAARAVDLSYLASSDSYIANIVGSEQMQSLKGYSVLLKQERAVEYPARRSYDAVAYGWSFGYGSTSDDGSGTGCGGGTPPCHRSGIAATDFFHGNYTNGTGPVAWSAGVTQQLPASFYLSSKPEWWKHVPFPATGPDVRGGSGPGGYSYGNPAQACYLKVMKGEDGGEGSPFAFDPNQCYGAGSAAEKTNE